MLGAAGTYLGGPPQPPSRARQRVGKCVMSGARSVVQFGPVMVEPVDVPGSGQAKPYRELGPRRSAIAATLARLGFISGETAERDNAAADILAEPLPDDSEIQVCLSCHDVSADGPYRFAEAKGVFRRPATQDS